MAVYNGNYVTTQAVRDEGVTSALANDDKVAIGIKAAERLIEVWCRRWFYRKQNTTLTIDGGDTYYTSIYQYCGVQTLFLPIPIISLTSVTIDGTVRDLTNFIVMNRIGIPVDDRWNPRIISKYSEFPNDGIQNIVLAGDFGFVEDTVDYTVPEGIKTASLKLAIRQLHLKKMTDPERDMDLNSSLIVEEETPGYRYRLSDKRSGKIGQDGFTGDTEIDDYIEYYRYKTYVGAV